MSVEWVILFALALILACWFGSGVILNFNLARRLRASKTATLFFCNRCKRLYTHRSDKGFMACPCCKQKQLSLRF